METNELTALVLSAPGVAMVVTESAPTHYPAFIDESRVKIAETNVVALTEFASEKELSAWACQPRAKNCDGRYDALPPAARLGRFLREGDPLEYNWLAELIGITARVVEDRRRGQDAITSNDGRIRAAIRVIYATTTDELDQAITAIDSGEFDDAEKTANARRYALRESFRRRLRSLREQRRKEEQFGGGQDAIKAIKAERKSLIDEAIAAGFSETDLA